MGEPGQPCPTGSDRERSQQQPLPRLAGTRTNPPDHEPGEHRCCERMAPEGDQAVHGGATVNCPDMRGSVAKLYK